MPWPTNQRKDIDEREKYNFTSYIFILVGVFYKNNYFEFLLIDGIHIISYISNRLSCLFTMRIHQNNVKKQIKSKKDTTNLQLLMIMKIKMRMKSLKVMVSCVWNIHIYNLFSK